ncbi:MAG: phosphoribosylaminoimidazolesuccinocarboxamide synthase [Candidatus Buchananbacteria bacterium CG10_big_fil_rev_8_21_14_0_10_42_9]|uniref:Phosphoribosylaminoimidazole-succinocarboxamide synthase n=1 Tax=Candidatus Buchananbacteria bacterium CG10_big_fil_rev_8_21_14_0_10_42_9 TaxID=1974526 RepID=A0A2H0W1B7_9BACT|nr:MAG: phosphoribosylaminoimidazolesuccinocarboxamide synthase [Candidatus Buchananbacteria bacterium CG10_big_fil_rev_8_21_14_0_10_42_9]
MNKDIIAQNISNVLTETNFFELGEKKIGKVHDSYFTDDRVILITTDRQSAFDRVLASIPFKGQVLNLVSAWWFEKTKHIVPNFIQSVPDPNVVVGQKTEVFPVEFVSRSFLTGTTSTSIWKNYEAGQREFGGITLPDGLKKNAALPKTIITPSTKFEEHDRNITVDDIINEKMMTQEQWDYVSSKAIEVFTYAQKIAKNHGLILVDTKYEFGKLPDGTILLIDEINTPDSSRYWLAGSYEDRIAQGEEPENIDKEFLRLWYADNCDPYKDKNLPKAPDELVIELSSRYIQLYEMITGEKFPLNTEPVVERIFNNLQKSGFLVQ